MLICAQCRAVTDRYYDRALQCKTCHDTAIQTLPIKLRTISGRLEYWMAECEKRYGKTIYYSNEQLDSDIEITGRQLSSTLSGYAERARGDLSALAAANQPGLTNDSLVKLGALDQKVRRSLKINGTAQGFISKSKDFEPLSSEEPAKCIRDFIKGRLTVCECENMMRAIFLNAICDVISDRIFNVVFSKFVLDSAKTDRFAQWRYLDEFKKPAEESIQPGDWVYIYRRDPGAFRNAVQDSGAGAASTGWNLLCTEPGKFMGFGLSDKDDHKSKTLKQCYAKANEGIKFSGAPARREQEAAFDIEWRRQMNPDRLKKLVETRLQGP